MRIVREEIFGALHLDLLALRPCSHALPFFFVPRRPTTLRWEFSGRNMAAVARVGVGTGQC